MPDDECSGWIPINLGFMVISDRVWPHIDGVELSGSC